jgi:hypothetical protein
MLMKVQHEASDAASEVVEICERKKMIRRLENYLKIGNSIKGMGLI